LIEYRAARRGVDRHLVGVGEVRDRVAHVPAARRRRREPGVGVDRDDRLELQLLGFEIADESPRRPSVLGTDAGRASGRATP
jgi:hypothetical protein